MRFPFLPKLEEPAYANLQTLEGLDASSGEVIQPFVTDRPVLVVVWVNTNEDLAWEQWQHLASVADHPHMDLVEVVVISTEGLEEMEAHSKKVGFPPDTRYHFVHIPRDELLTVYKKRTLDSRAATWVYLHKEPVFAQKGRLVPPREWLEVLQWEQVAF